ncbi:superoxide dismutase [Ni] [Psychrosphaera saromensis]|uniref:Superoxide dismutase, Ni n=1 Tax=Psychrosphaera saromensis TaxID=716813 RepID=A0A2S7UT02_9GAMM|nr:superoxide dismutase, Ni [Psychrosphaera saromensis]PQJ53067.1 superoxide dismutase, Ni [Psychrosphaera saromensis]GHB68353.1 superoxide dismutase [Ni] [Psychrosphaera saromensis]GLQ15184.1 superoxide dismutase [Ni] [Psychrosphaera saromensis]
MLHSILHSLDKTFSFKTASAHCDIPCKIYDPSTAQICALSMVRLVDLINEISDKEEMTTDDHAQLVRLVNEKETHGTKLKDEIRVIWGDYFKQPQIDKYPDIHTLVHQLMMQTSKGKQKVNREETIKILELVNDFATIFWETKGVATYVATCPYPPSLAVVYPKLDAL